MGGWGPAHSASCCGFGSVPPAQPPQRPLAPIPVVPDVVFIEIVAPIQMSWPLAFTCILHCLPSSSPHQYSCRADDPSNHSTSSSREESGA